MTGLTRKVAGADAGGRREGYVDGSVRQWQDYTGSKAFLDHDGRSFEEIAAERRGRCLTGRSDE